MPDQSSKTTPTSARVFDAAPPIGIAATLGPALLVASILFAIESSLDRLSLVLGISGVAMMLLYGLRPRKRPRQTRVFCNSGGLRIEGFGTIRARDIVGATTARFGDHVSLMLAHKRRKGPIIIELADDASLLAICKSLGVGHHGFGSVEVPTKPTNADTILRATIALTIAAFGAAVVAASTENSFGGLAASMMCATLVMTLATFATPQPKVRIAGNGVFLPTPEGTAFAPFDAIESIELLPHALVTTVRMDAKKTVVWRVDASRSRFRRQGSTQEELEHLVAQIRAAVDRAHGKFTPKTEPENALARLRRAPGEPLRAWLARLDTLTTGAAGYRDLAIEQPELWTLLEDPEADADTRAAAARVLARNAGDELKVRVANVLATERNERTRTRIAASLDDEVLAREEAEEAEVARLRAKV